MPFVIASIGGQEIDRRPLHEAIVIGRASDANIRPHDTSISRHHCTIQPLGADWFVRDLGSKNGTTLNGRVIQQAEKLQHGDILRIGRTTIHYLTTPFEPAPVKAQQTTQRPDEPEPHTGLSDTSLDLSLTRLPVPHPKKPK